MGAIGAYGGGLLPGLLAAARRNGNRGFADLSLFEVGQVFLSDRPEGQHTYATALRLGGSRKDWQGGASVGVFDAKACFQLASMGMTGGDSADRERLGMLDEPPPSSATLERRVPAGEPLVVGPRVVFPTATASDILHAMMPAQQAAMRARQAGVCRLPVFTPKAGEQYELRVDLTPGRCSVTPYHLVEHDGLVKREEMSVPASEVYTHEFDMKCFR